jgi:hypothetical protein
MTGIAGNNAELLNASRNSAKVNMVSSAILRSVDVFANSGSTPSSSSTTVGALCSSSVSVSSVFVAVRITSAPLPFSFLVGLAVVADRIGVEVMVGASLKASTLESIARPQEKSVYDNRGL